MERKRKQVPDVAVSAVGTVITFKFADGDSEVFDCTAGTTDEARQTAMVWGFAEKGRNATALSRDPETGRSPALADKKAELRRVMGELAAGGPWSVRGTGGGSDAGILLSALMLAYPDRSRESLAEYLSTKDKKTQAAMLASDRLRDHVAAVRAKRAAGVDLNEAWEELDSM